MSYAYDDLIRGRGVWRNVSFGVGICAVSGL